MAHPVPDEGDTVEVEYQGTTEEATVVEANGNYAIVRVPDEDTEDGEREIEARHADQAVEGRATYTTTEDTGGEGDEEAEVEAEVPEEPEAESEAELGLDPTEYTVDELEATVEDITDEQTLTDALAVEQEEGERSTAIEAMEDRLDELQSDE